MSFPEDNPFIKRFHVVPGESSGLLEVYEDTSPAVGIISGHYDLDDIVDIRPVTQGQVNDTFEVELGEGGKTTRLIFRKYQEGASRAHILFEHRLLSELAESGFRLSPRVIRMHNGRTFARVSDWQGQADRQVYIALFTFLEGTNLLNWDRPCCSTEELASAGEALREYHRTVFELSIKPSERTPGILDLLPGFVDRWRDFRSGSRACNRLFQNHLPSLIQTLEQTCLKLDRIRKDHWPKIIVHGDFHPGNLTFINGRVSGMFDFDWAHIDYRCLDPALALPYFCAHWGGARDGRLDYDRMKTFLGGYQNANGSAKGLDPLNASELRHLPDVMQAANLYVLDWILDYQEEFGAGGQESPNYLQHQINLIDWCRGESEMLARAFLKSGS